MRLKTDKNTLKALSFYLVIVVVFFAEIGVCLYLFPQQYSRITENLQQNDNTRVEIANLNAAVESVAGQDKITIEQYLERTRAALPDEKKTSGPIAGFVKLAGQYGVAVDTFEFSPGLISTASAATGYIQTNATGEVVSEAGVKAIPATLAVNGDIIPLKNFLDVLNISSQLMGVTAVNFTGSDKPGGKTELSLLMFYQPPKTGALTWRQIKPFASNDIKLLETLPEEDILKLPTE